MADLPMRTVFEDGRVEIRHRPGLSPAAIVAFTGIANALNGIEIDDVRFEFQRSLGVSAPDHNVYFVRDKARGWYNGTDRLIAGVLEDAFASAGIETAFTLGVSMGGFGAILFAERLTRCRRAIAFCPQSTVHPDIYPHERRWHAYTGSIADWTVPDLAAEPSTVERVIIYGAGDPADAVHAGRLASPHTVVLAVPDAAHSVAPVLKARGQLLPLLRRLLSQDAVTAAELAALVGSRPVPPP